MDLVFGSLLSGLLLLRRGRFTQLHSKLGDLGLQFLDASLELIDDRRHCRFGESPEDVL